MEQSTNIKLPIGTFVNMGLVIMGSLIGVMLQQVFPQSIQEIVFQAVGLGILIVGIQMSLKVPDGMLLLFIFSLILGGILGEWMNLQGKLYEFSNWVRDGIQLSESEALSEGFSEGMVTAFLLFCVGSITIVGAIEEGIQGKRELLYLKSALDGVTSIALASSYGIGVLFSIIPMLIVQGGLTIVASQAKPLFTKVVLGQISAVGGVLIIAMSFNLLEMAKIRVENLLPSILIVVILTGIYIRLKVKI